VRFNFVDAWYFRRDSLQDQIEALLVLPFQILNHVADVIASDAKVLLCACCRWLPCRVRLKVGKIPAFKEVAKPLDAGVPLQCAQGSDAQLPQVGKSHVDLKSLLLASLARPHVSFACREIQKRGWPAMRLAFEALP